MNKIEELLEKLCPNGVEYKKLEECCHILDNKRRPITKSKRKPGKYPYYGANGIQDYVEDYIFDGKFVLVGEDGSVINKNGNPIVTWAEDKIWVNNHAHIIEEIDGVSLRYLFHYLQIVDVTKLVHGSIPKLLQGDFRNLQIAVPPLEIQCEIVRILDKFSSCSTELIALLKAELKARKQQYEYYREKLLNFDDNNEVDYKLFGEIAKIQRGASPRPIRYYITKEQNGINWIKIGDVEEGAKYITSTHEKITEEGAKNSRYIKRGSLILSNSMSFGRPYILAIDGCIHDGWLSISNFEQFYTTDFLYFLLNSNKIQDEFKKKANFGGAIHNLNADIVRNIILPIPTIKKQNEIVKILDKFYSLCNDLTAGIPAEVEARQKQYEYYRDKLLTFKELKNE